MDECLRLRLRLWQFLPQLLANRSPLCNLTLMFTCVVLLTSYTPPAAATFGHEHVHIRVHVPQIKNEIHHTEKAIVNEIPVIRHRHRYRYKQRAHLYQQHAQADANFVNSIDDDVDVDADDSTGFAATGFHHRNLYVIDDGDGDGDGDASAIAHPHPLRNKRLEQRNKPSSSPQLLVPPSAMPYRLPFAITSIGRESDDDDDDYRYSKRWMLTAGTGTGTGRPTIALTTPAKSDTNLRAASYKTVKNYTPPSTDGAGGNTKHRQNVFDYYHTAPSLVSVPADGYVDADGGDDDDDDEDDDDEEEEDDPNDSFTFGLNSDKTRKSNGYSNSNYEPFVGIGSIGHSLPRPSQNLASEDHAYPLTYYAWPS